MLLHYFYERPCGYGIMYLADIFCSSTLINANTGSSSHTGSYRILPFALQWHHKGHDSISSYQPRDCLFIRLYRWKKTLWGIAAQMASNAENVSIWSRHHDNTRHQSHAIVQLCQWSNYEASTIIDPMVHKGLIMKRKKKHTIASICYRTPKCPH